MSSEVKLLNFRWTKLHCITSSALRIPCHQLRHASLCYGCHN